MQKNVARVLLGLPGLFIFASGVVFLANPVAAADKMLLSADSAEALSNLRGFAGAPVMSIGAMLLLSAFTARLEYARPAALFLLTLIGARVVSYLVDGPTDAIGLLVGVPVVAFSLMLAGHKLLDHAERGEEPARVATA